MLFNSFTFFVFLACVLPAYYALPRDRRWWLLLLGSLFFYATFSPAFVPVLLGVTLVAYVGGLRLGGLQEARARRATLVLSVVLIVGTLIAVKYYGFVRAAWLDAFGPAAAFPAVAFPVIAGLSFYVFSCVSYLADVAARRLPPERHFGYFAVYVSFFPKLLAGPIERAGSFLEQLRRPAAFDAARATEGCQLFLWGLFKKVVIADRLAAFIDPTYRQASFASPADLLIATYFVAFQIYCDFSGYSDMAIGISKMLGFELAENFRRPYFSTSVGEFWSRRWHISLGSWFRDYMYIPMGGSRVSRPRQVLNVLTVFLVSGLWHGANWTFIVWGGLNGLYQVGEQAVRWWRGSSAAPANGGAAPGRILRILLTFHLVAVSWVFFRAASVADATTIIQRIVASLGDLPRQLPARLGGDLALSVILILVLVAVEWFDERRSVWARLNDRPLFVRWSFYYALIVALVVIGQWNVRQFVYMQF